ncbi:MAG TPA: hypothetical protein VE737_04790 [Actinomycetota bacterium]|nr:hypothetical protein [Actinomycetota bacterium]
MTSDRFTTFDAVMLVLGAVFFALSALSVVATITVLLDPRTVDEWSRTGPGFISFAKGFGLVFFPLAALVTFATGWWLAGDQIRRLRRRGD